MVTAILLSIMAGVLGVWQAGLNKIIADSIGFTASLLFNGLFFLAFNFLFFLLVWNQPKLLPQEFAINWSLSEFKLWWIVPGFTGFALVMGLAISIGRIGAVQTFVVSIAAQIFASLAWDLYTGDFEMNKWRVIGAGVTLAGAILSTLS